jgi:hypothetical protein
MQEGAKMDDYTTTGRSKGAANEGGPCTNPFPLSALKEGKKDKLGHEVEEILWVGRNYAVYRSQKGVYVQFSDCPQEEEIQRCRFTEISPELCELRYLTYEMRSYEMRPRWSFAFGRPIHRHPWSLYYHNMAQALMLVMENKKEDGQQLAQQALKMAVDRVTNDNTVLYFTGCVIAWIVSIISGLVVAWIVSILTGSYATHSHELLMFIIAAMSGATGALLSVATRLQAFQLKPCQQSDMNYLMSCTRIGIGLIAGPVLLLLGETSLVGPIKGIVSSMTNWQGAAVLGLIGGFAERLIPNLFRQTTGRIESTAGTPVQAVRNQPTRGEAVKQQPAG